MPMWTTGILAPCNDLFKKMFAVFSKQVMLAEENVFYRFPV
jgi:hypothetical protein